jgi:hypothetical protein
MDFLHNIIAGFSNGSNANLYYAGAGILLILTMMFFRKVLFIMMILTGLAVAYLLINHFTGFSIPIDGLNDFNAESLISKTQHAFDSISAKMGSGPDPDAADATD